MRNEYALLINSCEYASYAKFMLLMRLARLLI